MRTLFILYCYLFFCLPSFSQIPDIRFEKYTVQDGLIQNSTGALLQDSHGFLWIGTSWGLSRYDGRVFKHYDKIGDNDLIDLSISALAEDREGKIWIATSNGLSCLDPFTERFTNYHEGKSLQNIPSGFCTVFVDKENNVWLGGINEISLYNRVTKSFEIFPISTRGKDIRINSYVFAFLEDSKGRFWISTSYGIKLFNREKKTYQSYHFEEINGNNIAQNAVQKLFEDKDGNIWAGTWSAGILKYDPYKNKFSSLKVLMPSHFLVQAIHDINAIIINNHYYLILASSDGLLLADPEKITDGMIIVEKILKEEDGTDAPSPKNKSMIMRDRQGNYWISGGNGLLKIDLSNMAFQWHMLPDEKFKEAPIFHIIPDYKEGTQKIFLTTKMGWWQYDLNLKTFRKYTLPKRNKDLLENINRFVVTANGYWFTSELGVGFYNPGSAEVNDITPLLRLRKESSIRTGGICMDNMGKIWFSIFRMGIRVFDPKTKKIISLFADSTGRDHLIGKSIFDMKKLPDGSILFTSGPKLFHVDPRDFSYTIIEQAGASAPGMSIERIVPRKILFDKKNRILILGLQRIYLFQNGKLSIAFPEHGVSNFIMQDFLQDSKGDFWITTNLGLYKTDEALKNWVNMSNKIPTGNSDNIQEVVFRPANDEFIMSTTGKIGTFSLADLGTNKISPSIVINRLRTGDKEQYFVSLSQKQWKVSFKDAIEIELSAINFSNEKGNRIFYLLRGRDDDWKELTGTSVVRYEQLPPGNYTFKVKAENGDVVWSKEVILSFRVLPPFYLTWWFIALLALIIVTILYAFYRFRIQQLFKQERLRSHIATDLHDDIGATLSSISFYSETIKQQTAKQLPQLTPLLEKMGETSRDMVGNMSDIVWAINPGNDSVEKMLTRMQNLAVELCTVKNVQLHFMADEKLNHLHLSMEQRRNIFLIFKEALNNALKYAECNSIKIELRNKGHFLLLMISDDGKGFHQKNILENSLGGNGLRNMRQRAAEINGELEIDTKENKGTTIVLIAPIT